MAFGVPSNNSPGFSGYGPNTHWGSPQLYIKGSLDMKEHPYHVRDKIYVRGCTLCGQESRARRNEK
jgi:hypothetical protein